MKMKKNSGYSGVPEILQVGNDNPGCNFAVDYWRVQRGAGQAGLEKTLPGQ